MRCQKVKGEIKYYSLISGQVTKVQKLFALLMVLFNLKSNDVLKCLNYY